MQPPPILEIQDLSLRSLQTVRNTFYRYGVVLLRGGLSLERADFEDLTRFFCDRFHDVGTRQKLQISQDSYTTEVYRQNFILLGHTEGSYRQQPAPPDMCFFMCIEPSCSGGETTLVDGVEMLDSLPASVRELFLSHGIRYKCSWDKARWMAELKVQSTEELTEYFSRNTDISYKQTEQLLDVEFPAKAITESFQGYPVFANSILSHLKSINHPAYEGLPVYANNTNDVLLNDGGSLPEEIKDTLIDTHDKLTYKHKWQKNDVLLIDNTRFMHGRKQAFDTTPRIIISRFGYFNKEFCENMQ